MSVCLVVMVFGFAVFNVVNVLQSLVLYGLYTYVMELLDAALETSGCAGVSIYQCHRQWRGECHVITSLQVKTLVLTVVSEAGEWERRLVENIVPVIACLKNGAEIKDVVVEGEVLTGWEGSCFFSFIYYSVSCRNVHRSCQTLCFDCSLLQDWRITFRLRPKLIQ